MIYFDNAATSFPKPRCVIEDLNFCLKKRCGNPGRSGHKLSLAAAEEVYEAREKIASHLNFGSPENIVFTYNATYAINIALNTKIKKGSHILTSDIEHNAVMRPLELMRKRGDIDYSIFSTDGDIRESIVSALKPSTTAIVSTLVSNVTGKEIPLKILSDVASQFKLILIVDASQAAGHRKIDLSATPCDCLCAPGHKGLFGIQGSGFAVFSSGNDIVPFIAGGSGTNSKNLEMPLALPEALEAGTVATPAIATLRSGVNFIDTVGLDEIEQKESMLTNLIKDGLSSYRKVVLYESFGSIVLFNISGISEAAVCSELDKYGICVRGGLHCAPSVHKKLGTENTGAIRISLSCFNTENEIKYFLKTVGKIAAEL